MQVTWSRKFWHRLETSFDHVLVYCGLEAPQAPPVPGATSQNFKKRNQPRRKLRHIFLLSFPLFLLCVCVCVCFFALELLYLRRPFLTNQPSSSLFKQHQDEETDDDDEEEIGISKGKAWLKGKGDAEYVEDVKESHTIVLTFSWSIVSIDSPGNFSHHHDSGCHASTNTQSTNTQYLNTCSGEGREMDRSKGKGSIDKGKGWGSSRS